ncbi:MAG: radical SAM protein [Candidatus Hecatellales archaeon]|nr:MAG: radical SAM protein [Candidatus Hecatellales archaeon]
MEHVLNHKKLREAILLVEKLGGLSFEIGPIRPPSEGGSRSLLLRVTRNCPWRLCTFCYGIPYRRQKFQLRPVKEVMEDLDQAKSMADLLKEISLKLGYEGKTGESLLGALLKLDPTLGHHESFLNLFNWLSSGGKTVFLQDADSLIIPTRNLVEILKHLKKLFPQVERVTSYARAKTLTAKPLEDLKLLRSSGLSRLHVGLESGDDEVLKKVNKGVTSREHVEAGRKVIEAGIELSLYVMSGLGGVSLSRQHAENTADVLNRINPHFVRVRTFLPLPGTPLFDEYRKGNFKLLSPHQCLSEIRLMVEKLEITGRICFDHFINPSLKNGFPIFRQDYEGYKLPEEKSVLLETIDRALELEESELRWLEELVGLPCL